MRIANRKIQEQGDVVLIPVNSVKGKELKSKVVQEGEHTGHAHRLMNGTGTLFETEDGTKYLSVRGESEILTHEEHAPHLIEEGDYEVRIVRQKDPFTKLIAPVVD